jgi:hypothetical protein
MLQSLVARKLKTEGRADGKHHEEGSNGARARTP